MTAPDPLTEIIPGLYLIAGQNGGRFPYVHTFVVDGDVRALVDTGAELASLCWTTDHFPIDKAETLNDKGTRPKAR